MLKWDYHSRGKYTPDGFAKTDIGDLHLCCRKGRAYKDGTYQYSFWISVPGGESMEFITVAKVRGHLADAQAKAEEFAQNLLESLTVLAEEKEKPELVVVHTMDELKTYIESKGWKVDNCGFGNDEVGWEVSQYSPAGEDFVFYLQHNNDVEEAVSLLKKYAYNFDEEEHIAMYIKAGENGLEGVPSAKKLVEDAAEIQAMLDDLADGVNWCEQSTVGEICKNANETREDLFSKAVSYYSSDAATDILNDFVKKHADEYIYGYQHRKDLIDIDFWCRYEELLGEKLSWDEYVELDNYVDGSPEDISPEDGMVMKALKDRLAAFRKQNRVDALLIEISNLHHEIQGVLAYDEDKAEDIKKRLLEVLKEFHELAPKDHIYHQMCDIYGFSA